MSFASQELRGYDAWKLASPYDDDDGGDCGCDEFNPAEIEPIRERTGWYRYETNEGRCHRCGGRCSLTDDEWYEVQAAARDRQRREYRRELLKQHPILGRWELAYRLFARLEYRWREIDRSNQHHDTSEIPF